VADWEQDSWQLANNLDRLLLEVSWRRDAPVLDREVIREWHRIMLTGLRVPNVGDCGTYRGEGTLVSTLVFIRDLDPPHDRVYGASPEHVARELGLFEAELRRRLSGVSGNSGAAAKSELAAWMHGEWVRIHPFANGNGRIARLLANWVLFRLYERPVVVLRPRPVGDAHARAAMESMRDGRHGRMAAWIEALLRSE
jgi:Fic family protein